jgi:hypothetical protein
MEYHELWHYTYRAAAEDEDEAIGKVLLGEAACLEGEYKETLYDESEPVSVEEAEGEA